MDKSNRFDCSECGQGVKADEDGCCVTCGRECSQVEDGKLVYAPDGASDRDTVIGRVDDENGKE